MLLIKEGDMNDQISDVKVMLVKGIDGEGIESIEKTGTSGLVDTYTITYTDGEKTTFTVTNGKAISTIEKTSTVGAVDTYTITYNDGSTDTFEVTNGTVASAIAYDNTESGLQGATVQAAIDELRDSSNISYGTGTVEDALDECTKKLDYAHAISILSLPYTAPSRGVAYLTVQVSGAGMRVFSVNDVEVARASCIPYDNGYYGTTATILMEKGDILSSPYSVAGTYKFVPYA